MINIDLKLYLKEEISSLIKIQNQEIDDCISNIIEAIDNINIFIDINQSLEFVQEYDFLIFNNEFENYTNICFFLFILIVAIKESKYSKYSKINYYELINIFTSNEDLKKHLVANIDIWTNNNSFQSKYEIIYSIFKQ